MITKRGKKIMKDFQIILEESAFDEKEVKIKTKSRGTITGMFIAPDEFDSNPDRYGFQIEISEHILETIFLDEIIDIELVKITEQRHKSVS